jgi:uncharacterized protein YvpB
MAHKVLKRIVQAYLTKFAEPKIKDLTGEDISLTLDDITNNRYKEVVVFINTDPKTTFDSQVEKVIKHYVYMALDFGGEDSVSSRVIINKQTPVWYEETITEDKKVRVFTESVEGEELKWHRDREDRVVKVLESNKWFLQMDDELPKELVVGESYLIPQGTYHRVIKGKGDLKVSITFI